ncbi:MAG TPA: hypothetical protein VKA67_05190 [Verrucomicrobiae bacterium]|nr:hypothetical protein [Verrucomicrobiae bacterium]
MAQSSSAVDLINSFGQTLQAGINQAGNLLTSYQQTFKAPAVNTSGGTADQAGNISQTNTSDKAKAVQGWFEALPTWQKGLAIIGGAIVLRVAIAQVTK